MTRLPATDTGRSTTSGQSGAASGVRKLGCDLPTARLGEGQHLDFLGCEGLIRPGLHIGGNSYVNSNARLLLCHLVPSYVGRDGAESVSAIILTLSREVKDGGERVKRDNPRGLSVIV